MSITGQRRPRLAGLAAAFTAVAVMLTACGGENTSGASDSSDSSDAGDKDYSVLRLASSTQPGSWDPALQLSAFDGMWQWTAVYDTLLTCHEDGSVSPGAAESYEFSDDHTVLTLTLRDGMTFSDGTPIDAAAVNASIEHVQNGGGSAAARVAGITIETPDERTVVLTAPEPSGLLPVYMCLSPGIVASPEAIESDTVDSVPVASGPYTFDAERSTSGSVLTFVRRDDYWNADAYPYQEVIVSIMPDVTARLNALKTGQVDGAALNGETTAEAEASGLTVHDYVDATNGIVIFDRAGETVPALGDARVRQALNMVFDREAIASGLFQGQVDPTTQMFGSDTDAYVEELDDHYEYDVEAAKKLMEDAGYADGFTVEIPARSPQTEQANPLIVQQLAELNITVEEVPLAAASAVQELLSGRFAMTYLSMPLASGLWSMQQSISPAGTWNVNGNADPELTELTETAQTAQDDELTGVLQEINRYTVENAWFVPWNQRVAYFATAGDVELITTGDVYTKIPQLRDFQ
ncbi:ABC transporter substrate-binding protein [Phytoactinopolyspora endophytica]|uniref:ABC transporter substrate-binding protein n=1 Tax=Phytoactinopolyspora endophytica TaxID=1642495 RepID=UPI0013EE0105|nr:ABC transporter substrate-binding protein [Phytoactinopolyspora endophytica]